MKNIDMLLCHPRHLDYLWFRYSLPWIKEYMNSVIIAFTQDTMTPNISDFVVHQKEYDSVRWVKPKQPSGSEDWRDVAVKDMLFNFSKSPYVLFYEQDFLMKPIVLEKVIEALDVYDFIYYREGERIHPAFAITPRELALKSSTDFAVHPSTDHFYEFFNTLPYKKGVELRDIGLVEKEDFYHMAGFSNNYHVYKIGQPFYKQDEFITYNSHALRLPLQIEGSFKKLMEDIERDYGKGDCEYIAQFFL